MAKIIISPYSQKLRNGKENPKNYPYWKELVELLKDDNHIVQLGVDGDKKLVNDCLFNVPLYKIEDLVRECDYFICVDTFLQHLAHYQGKRGAVIWGQSDPNLFGYKENLNILKDRKYLRKNQYWLWEQAEYNKDAFVSASDVYEAIKKEFY